LKKSLSIVIIAVLALISCALIFLGTSRRGFLAGHQEKGEPSLVEEGGVSPEEASQGGGGAAPQEKSFTGKIADALKLGQAMKCTWSEGGITAVSYIKGGKYRSEVTSDGEKINYLYRDDCVYLWGEGEAQGIKWCGVSAEGGAPGSEGGAFGAELGYDYSCLPAVVSDSLFELPQGVSFVDTGSLTP